MGVYKKENSFYLETENTSYVFCVYDDFPVHLYYGKKIERCDLTHLIDRQIYSFFPAEAEDKTQLSSVALEYAGANTGDFRICGVNVEDGAGRIGCRLKYAGFSIREGAEVPEGLPHSRTYGACETLTVELEDRAKGLSVSLYYTVFPESDVIARHAAIVNREGECRLTKAASFVLDFLPRAAPFNLLQLAGTVGHEFGTERCRLTPGVKSFGSNKGFTSHASNPFFCLLDKAADENAGEAYGFNLVYSGGFLCEVELDDAGKTRVAAGIHPETFSWRLGAGERFTTPQAILTYSDCGVGKVSRNFHKHVRAGILPARFAFAPRPVVVNTWETYGASVDEEKVTALAQRAVRLGIDTVVLDDGWFRSDNRTGLGEWEVDRRKFPSGLGALSDRLHGMGLRFGLWIEPEMASRDGRLVKEHPDWIVQNGDAPFVWRSQYTLDFANPDVVKYIGDKMEEALCAANLDFVKWDANRYVSEAGSLFVREQGEVWHRMTLGLYGLLERLTTAHPNVLFESCAGGGGRFDPGMLYYTPQIWTSDNTDPFHRKDIQRGASLAYPPSALSCHVTASGDGSLDFRYLVASFGAYGYEFDLSSLTPEQAEKVASFSRRYRDEEEFVLRGELYRLCDERSYTAYMLVLPDKSRALLTFLQLERRQGLELAHL